MYSITLTNGVLDKTEIVQWADAILAEDDEPDYLVIELSLCGSKSNNDIAFVINNFTGPVNRISARAALGFLYHSLSCEKISLKKAVECIDNIVCHFEMTEQENSFMYAFHNNYCLAEDTTHTTLESVAQDTLSFLAVYKDFLPGNSNDWKRIDLTIADSVDVLYQNFQQENIKFSRSKKKWWKI